jgi:hypothetical protein
VRMEGYEEEHDGKCITGKWSPVPSNGSKLTMSSLFSSEIL